MVSIDLMKETFGLTANNNNHLLNNSFICHGSGLSEDEYINQLISAVEKRPVLYNVHLLDYKNKNKKGEAFKEVQQVMRAAGCNEQQGGLDLTILMHKFSARDLQEVDFAKTQISCGIFQAKKRG
jgi:hypothetical protein